MKYILLFLLIPMVVFSQVGISQSLWTTVNDTIGSFTTDDSVEVQIGNSHGPWKLLTKTLSDTAMITRDDKAAEHLVIFYLSGETWWTYTPAVRFRIYSTGVDTVTSSWVGLGGLDGAVTLFIHPDKVGTNVFYNKSWIAGH